MANLYFTDSPLSATTTSAELTGDEARHAVQVARVRVGDSFDISDGAGWRATATVVSADKSRVVCSVSNPRFDGPSGMHVVLAQALAKGDRDELAVQAATELGVAQVIPWQAERSVSRWTGDKVTKGVTRWNAIVREAAKQSMRSRIPTVEEPESTATLGSTMSDVTWLVLDPRADSSLTQWYRDAGNPNRIGIIVGPEGGISDAEIVQLSSRGVTPVRLDGPVLRTSTAGPAAIAGLLALSGAW